MNELILEITPDEVPKIWEKLGFADAPPNSSIYAWITNDSLHPWTTQIKRYKKHILN
jgi:hypothetical protein